MQGVDFFLQQTHQLQTAAQVLVSESKDERHWTLGARDLLQEFLGGLKFDPLELLEACMFRQGPVPTFASLGFSDHPLTLWSTNQMSLDVYYWQPGETAPHDHGFHGAFMPIQGEYSETIYQFHPSHDVGEGVVLGELIPGPREILPNGKAVAIHHAPDFIHQVTHESFCVTLCLRSKFMGQAMSDYYLPGIKLSTQKEWSIAAIEDWQRLRLLREFKKDLVPSLIRRASMGTLARWWLKEMYPAHRQDIKESLREEILQRPFGKFLMTL